MVIKKDPRKVLDMLSKPVDVDEDEFLNTLDANKSFNAAPDKPSANELGNVGIVMNEEQQRMLTDIADHQVAEEDLDGAHSAPAPGHEHDGIELNEKERRFFNLFKGTKEHTKQASLPKTVDLNSVAACDQGPALPRVGETQQEKDARAEDDARRAAYLEEAAKAELKANSALKKAHDGFVSTFDAAKSKH